MISKSLCASTPIAIECSVARRRCRNTQERIRENGPTSVTYATSPSLNFPRCKNISESMSRVSRTNVRSVDELFPRLAIWSAIDASIPETSHTSVKCATKNLALEVTWASTCRSTKAKRCHTNAQSAKRHISIKQVWESISRLFTNRQWAQIIMKRRNKKMMCSKLKCLS